MYGVFYVRDSMDMKILHSIKVVSLISLATLSSVSAHEEAAVVVDKVEKRLTVSDYETRKIHGWTVYIEKAVLSNARYDACIVQLNANLAQIKKLIDPEIVAQLQAVPIWLNNDIRMGACYHPNPKWLKQNNRMAEKAHGIELDSVDSYLDWAEEQPYVILHELAHAYHHRVFQFNQPDITKAFKKAEASKSYEKVRHISGDERRHYGLSNEKEYFSECTEAYFGRNDFYPFTRAELKKHDPAGYAMVETLWKVNVKVKN